MQCSICGREAKMCKVCGGTFCEFHMSFHDHVKRTNRTSISEVRDIGIAWVVLGVAFFNAGFVSGIGGIVAGLAAALVVTGLGFVMHELAHKFTAQHYGCWAEFRMWKFGVVFALVTSFLGFIFAAPGATYFTGTPDKRETGIIGIAGPAVNLTMAAVFFPLTFLSGYIGALGATGLYINIFLAMFNLIPLSILDGAKVYKWNRAAWAASFVPPFLVFLLVFIL